VLFCCRFCASASLLWCCQADVLVLALVLVLADVLSFGAEC
jgi:hypothetical protein